MLTPSRLASTITTSERTPRVILRHFHSEDALSHLQGEDEEISRWLSGGVSTEDSVRQWIQSNDENWSNDGPRYAFAIETTNSQLAGMIEINVDHAHFAGLIPGDANVSYGAYPSFRRLGLVSSAVLMVEDFMRSKGAQRAVIRVEEGNAASINLAQRCDYERVGTVINNAGTEFIMFVKSLTLKVENIRVSGAPSPNH